MVRVWFVAFWNFLRKIVLIFAGRNKSHGSCYWVNGSYFYSGSYFYPKITLKIRTIDFLALIKKLCILPCCCRKRWCNLLLKIEKIFSVCSYKYKKVLSKLTTCKNLCISIKWLGMDFFSNELIQPAQYCKLFFKNHCNHN